MTKSFMKELEKYKIRPNTFLDLVVGVGMIERILSKKKKDILDIDKYEPIQNAELFPAGTDLSKQTYSIGQVFKIIKSFKQIVEKHLK